MAYLIGTDEAGYGPNLGPLVIVATLWRVADEQLTSDLYDVLANTVTCTPLAAANCSRVCIADSKALYKPQAGLARLERGVLAALAANGSRPASWRKLWTRLDPSSHEQRASLPWYRTYDATLPLSAEPLHVESTAATFRTGLAATGVDLQRVCARAIFPARFNAVVAELGSKGAALTHWTLELIRSLISDTGGEAVLVNCDKHGGRNRYAGALQHFFPEQLVEIHHESRAESLYHLRRRESPAMEIRFRARGETFLPSALASMVAKYLRETAMLALNEYWCSHVSGLKPTAGYPVDARRFKAEIAETQREQNIGDRILWRVK